MAALVQTIAVVDKSGKAVSTSKHLINVFKEAKSAYRERKAEIVAGRQLELDEKRARRALKGFTIDDGNVSTTSSRRHASSRHSSHRPPTERHRTSPSLRGSRSPTSPTFSQNAPHEVGGASIAPTQLVRRNTDRNHDFSPPLTPSRAMTTPTSPTRAVAKADDIDMDLAYGPIPPPLPVARVDEELELKGLVNKVKMLLEEADCIQHTASATIAKLQKDPDALAAVALTMAEISNIASKMAPGALLAMKGSAPAVFALLASPQFLIAGGVAVGVTVVALGGYKVIKKIKAKNASNKEGSSGMDEMLEIDAGDVSRIDNWRRGIAEVEAQSVGTSVDGEFITPQAAALSRLDLTESGVDGSEKPKTRKKKSGEKSMKASSEKKEKSEEKRKERKVKEKKPSSLRMMFH